MLADPAALEREPESAFLQYFVRLAIFHEDMHAEAFHYTRQTHGYPDPMPDARATHQADVPQFLYARARRRVLRLPDLRARLT